MLVRGWRLWVDQGDMSSCVSHYAVSFIARDKVEDSVPKPVPTYPPGLSRKACWYAGADWLSSHVSQRVATLGRAQGLGNVV